MCWLPVVLWLLYIPQHVSPLSSGDNLCCPVWLDNTWLFLSPGRLCQQSHSCMKKVDLSCWSPFRCPSLNDKLSAAITWVTTQPILIINSLPEPKCKWRWQRPLVAGDGCDGRADPTLSLMCSISSPGVEQLVYWNHTAELVKWNKQNESTSRGYDARWPLPLRTVFSWKP